MPTALFGALYTGSDENILLTCVHIWTYDGREMFFPDRPFLAPILQCWYQGHGEMESRGLSQSVFWGGVRLSPSSEARTKGELK